MRVLVLLLNVTMMFCILSCKKTTEPNSSVVQAPVFNPSSGTYEIGQVITMTCPTSGVEIRYTTDGSEPGAESILYVTPMVIPTIFPSNSNTGIVKAKAYKEGYEPSTTSTAVYAVTYANTVAVPVIIPPSMSIVIGTQVSISCSTTSAQIHYTINGSEPTVTSTLYTQSFALTQDGQVTVKAKAFRDTWNPSSVVSISYTVTVPEPIPGMIFITGGTFNNGTSDVALSSFYLGKFEITQAEYQAGMGTNPSNFIGVTNRPVESVSWFNAIEYCNRRSINEGLSPCYNYSTYGTNPSSWPAEWNTDDNNQTNVFCSWTDNGYRLPTEAEWEFAARGGNQTHNYTFSGSDDLNVVAWNNSNSGNTTHIVGTNIPNELGIFDMSGNVWEWNWDNYGTYPSGAQTNPHGSDSSWSWRVTRGGSWSNSANGCTVSCRGHYYPTDIYNNLGFRICRIAP